MSIFDPFCIDDVEPMLERAAREARGEHAAVRLASLMMRELGVPIDAEKLRDLLQHQWSRVSALAHAVHNAGE